MSKYKNISEVFKKWGERNQKVPENNLSLKNEILEKVPFAREEIEIKKEKRSLPWVSIGFASIAILFMLGSSIFTSESGTFNKNNTVIEYRTPSSSFDLNDILYEDKKQIIPTWNVDGTPINDSREFLKTNYNATLLTRKIENKKTQIEIIVRGLGGRIDSSNGNKKYSNIVFAIPVDKFEIFRMEIKNLGWEKLFSENISSLNLLPEKQSIEESQKWVVNEFTTLKSERNQIVKNHTSVISGLSLRLRSIDQEISILQYELQTANADRRYQIESRLSQLSSEKNNILNEQANENKNYQIKLNSIDIRIKNTQNELKNLGLKDQKLMDNVATINGNISLRWVSLWEMGELYIPGPMVVWLLFIAAIISYFFWHRNSYISI
ncbi:hypothetical protein COW91_02490 [Candidatus Nomurabacteria bacterium CG22_combo_CG10-13_8_21_14_all_32_8]|uniref:Uncharacterized protein n=2 Tax=Candidatus Nomuraibacteriota TaxID=1752729 RepID=A0A2H0CG54_9BACT|nr:MAG: hypothetical protein COW91_02490 [Candidatus Nomurabacteria bacterium CG22_combo_CG10-13_8_21_14_all_32_8]